MYQNKIWIVFTVLSGFIDQSPILLDDNKLECQKNLYYHSEVAEYLCLYQSMPGDSTSSILEYSMGRNVLAKSVNLDQNILGRKEQNLGYESLSHFFYQRVNTTSISGEKIYINEPNDVCDDLICWKHIDLTQAQILLVTSDSQPNLYLVKSSILMDQIFLTIILLIINVTILARRFQNQSVILPQIVILFSLLARLIGKSDYLSQTIISLSNIMNQVWLRYQILMLDNQNKIWGKSKFLWFLLSITILNDLNNTLVILDHIFEGYSRLYINPFNQLDLFSSSLMFGIIQYLQLYEKTAYARISFHLSLRRIILIISQASNHILLPSLETDSFFWIILFLEQADERFVADHKINQQILLSIAENQTDASEMSEVN